MHVSGPIGFILNPIAGMGGRLGLGGTDGEAYKIALSRGAQPWSPRRAEDFLLEAKRIGISALFLSCAYPMGSTLLDRHGFSHKVVYMPASPYTSREDTIRAAKAMERRGVKLIVFVGGDGTARDVVEAVDMRVPILGIPAGVKMFSSVFSITPRAAARVLKEFLLGGSRLVEAEILDIDEEMYRRGVLNVRLFGYALVPTYGDLIQASKSPSSLLEEEVEGIAKWLYENREPDALYIFGPGSTVKKVAEYFGLKKGLITVAAMLDEEKYDALSDKDLGMLVNRALRERRRVYLVLSPIGSQGFLLGRGNLQLSPEVLRKIGRKGVIVVSTRRKLRRLRRLLVDTGDPSVDRMFSGYIRVVTGYGEETVISISSH